MDKERKESIVSSGSSVKKAQRRPEHGIGLWSHQAHLGGVLVPGYLGSRSTPCPFHPGAFPYRHPCHLASLLTAWGCILVMPVPQSLPQVVAHLFRQAPPALCPERRPTTLPSPLYPSISSV